MPLTLYCFENLIDDLGVEGFASVERKYDSLLLFHVNAMAALCTGLTKVILTNLANIHESDTGRVFVHLCDYSLYRIRDCIVALLILFVKGF